MDTNCHHSSATQFRNPNTMKVESNVINSSTLVAIDSFSFFVINKPNWIDYLVFSLGDDKVSSIMAWAIDTIGFSARSSSAW